MTNLNVPGLGTFDDIAAYIESVGNAARNAARALARADTASKNAALVQKPSRATPARAATSVNVPFPLL